MLIRVMIDIKGNYFNGCYGMPFQTFPVHKWTPRLRISSILKINYPGDQSFCKSLKTDGNSNFFKPNFFQKTSRLTRELSSSDYLIDRTNDSVGDHFWGFELINTDHYSIQRIYCNYRFSLQILEFWLFPFLFFFLFSYILLYA